MDKTVYLTNMFPDYEPPEELRAALSQAAIAAADIDPEERTVCVAVHCPNYIPQRHLDTMGRDIANLYGLKRLALSATHPEEELQKIEPEELLNLFVSRNSMMRGTLAGAQWTWQDKNLHIQLMANGKKDLEELIPQVQAVLRERFAAPVTITVEAGKALEGKELMEAMESMRASLMQNLPAARASQPEKSFDKAAPYNLRGKRKV